MSILSEKETARARARAALMAMTDDEAAAITAAAEADPDNPPLTETDFDEMRPASEFLSPILMEHLRANRDLD
mgnify:CR=1 FL=1